MENEIIHSLNFIICCYDAIGLYENFDDPLKLFLFRILMAFSDIQQ